MPVRRERPRTDGVKRAPRRPPRPERVTNQQRRPARKPRAVPPRRTPAPRPERVTDQRRRTRPAPQRQPGPVSNRERRRIRRAEPRTQRIVREVRQERVERALRDAPRLANLRDVERFEPRQRLYTMDLETGRRRTRMVGPTPVYRKGSPSQRKEREEFRRRNRERKQQAFERATAPALKVLEQTTRPVHAVAGGARAAVRGENIPKAVGRGAALKDRHLFSDVLKEAGVDNKAIRAVAGFGLDVALDPTTYLTAGASVPAKTAAREAGTRAHRQAVQRGATPRKANRAARKAERKVERTDRRTNRGIELKFAGKPVPGMARATSAASRAVRLPQAAERARGTAAHRLFREVAPRAKPPGVTREQHEALRASVRESRAVATRGRARAIAVAQGLRKALPEEDYGRVVNAIERGTVYNLPDRLRKPAEAAQQAFRKARTAERKAGIDVPNRRHYFAHVLAEESAGKGGKRGGRVIRPEYAKGRKHQGTIKDIAARTGIQFSEDVPTVTARRLTRSAVDVAAARLNRALAATGRRVRPGEQIALANDEAVFRVRGAAIKRLDESELRRLAKGADDIEGVSRQELIRRLRAAEAKGSSKRARARLQVAQRREQRELGRTHDIRVPQESRKTLRNSPDYRDAALRLSRATRELTAARKAHRNAHAGARSLYTDAQRAAADRRLVAAEAEKRAAQVNFRSVEQRVLETAQRAVRKRAAGEKLTPAEAAVVGLGRQPTARLARLEKARAEAQRAASRVEEVRAAEREARKLRRMLATHGDEYVVLNERAVKDAIQRALPGVTRTEAGRLYDRIQGGFKWTATIPNPGFHFRNLVGDAQNAYLVERPSRLVRNIRHAARTLKALGRQEEAVRNLTTPKRTSATVKVRDRYGNKQSITYDQLAREAEQHGAIRAGFVAAELPELARDVNRVRNVGKGTTRRLGRFLQNREDLIRLATYIGGRQRGLSPREATERALRQHFDYADLTPFEKTTLRRFFPFYTFSARNIPLQAKHLVTTPGKFANVEKARLEAAKAFGFSEDWQNDLREYQQRGVPIPVRWKGHQLAISPALPLNDLNQLAIPGFTVNSLAAAVDEQAKKAGSMLSPLAKTPIELYANYHFFFRGDIERDDSPLVAAPGWVENMPASWRRRLGVVDDYLDKRTGRRTWGWPGKVDYVAELPPGPFHFLSQISTPGTNRRGQGPSEKALSWLVGFKPDPVSRIETELELAYKERQRVQRRLAALRQRGQSLTAGTAGAEYKRLSRQDKRLTEYANRLRQMRGDKVIPGLARRRQQSGNLFDGGEKQQSGNLFDSAPESSSGNLFD